MIYSRNVDRKNKKMSDILRSKEETLDYLKKGYIFVHCPADHHKIDKEMSAFIFFMSGGQTYNFIVCTKDFQDVKMVHINVAIPLLSGNYVEMFDIEVGETEDSNAYIYKIDPQCLVNPISHKSTFKWWEDV